MLDELRRVALFGSGVAELTRNRAEQLVKDLTGGGLGAADARGIVKDLMERSRDNRKEIVSLVRGEIENQVSNLGLATRRDVEKLERRVERLEERYRKLREEAAAARKAPAKTPARKTSSAKPAGTATPRS